MNKATIIMLAASLQPALGYAQNAGELLGINLNTILGAMVAILGIAATVIVTALRVIKRLKEIRKDNKEEFKEVKEEFKEAKKDLKEDFKEVKKDFKGVKEEFKEEFKEVKKDLKKVNDTVGSLREVVAELTGRITGRVEGLRERDKQGVSPERTTGAPQEHLQKSRHMQPPGEVHNPEERKRKEEGPSPSL